MEIKIAIFLLAVCWQTVEGDKLNTSWILFLQNLDDYLSGPTVQLDLKRYLVNDLKHWGKCSKTCSVVENLPERIDTTLEYINRSYADLERITSRNVELEKQMKKLLKSEYKTAMEYKIEIIDELVRTLRFVEIYKKTDLIEMLENSYSNFTNETLKTVENEMIDIRKEVIQTFCTNLYKTQPDHCIKAYGNGPPHITKENFREFLFILKKGNNETFYPFICWANVELGEKQLKEVNLVLKVNLKEDLEVQGTCEGNRTIFSGNIVRVTDPHLNDIKKCGNDSGEIVQIMASNTIYIDRDLIFRRENMLVAIMAPTVVVVGDRKIQLNGQDASQKKKYPRGQEYNAIGNYIVKETNNWNLDHLQRFMKQCIDDMDMDKKRKHGCPFHSNIKGLYFNKTIDSPHGAPGLPGQTGGSFFGLANVFVNSSKLTIMSNGGKGGFGQYGAHGRRGENGTVKRCLNSNPKEYFECEFRKPKVIIWKPEDDVEEFPDSNSKRAKFALFSGELAVNGTDGGHGGAGGEGGNPGQIRIITLDRNDSFNIHAQKGESGVPGLAGGGGFGGYTPSLIAKIYIENFDSPIQVMRNEKRFDDGKAGIDGNNTTGMQEPSPAPDINANLETLMTAYRIMLKKCLETHHPSTKIFNHLMSVLKQTQIVGNCSTSSVVNELLEYENSFYRLHKKLDYTKLYSTLLNYTERKVENVQEPDDKKALHYTYTAILSKLHAIKNHKEEKYIANLNNFLNMFVEKLKKYKEKKREIAIIEESDRYKAEIDKQIEDANSVVSNSIMPKLEELFTQIDRDLEELKREVDAKEKELLAQRKKLLEQKEKMKKNFLARLFGNILKLVGSIVSLFGPIGQIAGKVIQGASSVMTKFVVDQSAYEKPELATMHLQLEGVLHTFEAANNHRKLITKDIDVALNTFNEKNLQFDKEHNKAQGLYQQINGNIENVKNTFEYIKKTYTTAIKDLQNMRKSVSAYGDFTNDVYQKCKNVYQNVKTTISSGVEKVKGYFTEADKFLSKGFKFVKNTAKTVQNFVGTAKSVAETVKTSLKFVNTAFKSASGVIGKFAGFAIQGIDIVKNFGSLVTDALEDRAQMEEIDRALAENEKSLDAIRKYRKEIDNSMKPMLEGMKNTVRNFPNMCKGKSEAQLMTHGWQVDQFLDKISSIMTEMTKEFQIGASFKNTISSIKEAVSLMTNIFRKIQDYGDKKKLSNHMANLQLAGSDIQISNAELRNYTIRLSAAIEANLLLFDYRVWVKQIRLFVFPLPDTYLQTFKVPMAFESDEAHTLVGYTENAIKAVERFRNQYIESHVYINKFDKFKHRAFFYNDTQMGPFFVWKNENHRRAISRLFAGESVVFEALTMRSGMNALKFRRIDLVMRTKKKNQTLLNDILKNFMVRMKHIGNNYYNCDNITYVATVVGQVFKFSYQYINREPVDINVVYDKILHGDYMLSPYTTWYIKLINPNPKSYKLLREFRRDVDIELSGEGEYFEDKSEVCEDDLSEYYQTKNQFKRKKPKVYDECPARAIVKKGFLCCEFNSTFDSKDKEWCRAIVRKPETLGKVHNTSEDNYYYYYDRYFRKSALSSNDIKTKFRGTCSLHHGSTKCIEAFKNRQAYRPWFFYHDKAGGPFSRSYLYCVRGKCLARIEKALGPLAGLKPSHENDKYYFYARQFNESSIQAQDRSKYERCSPSDADCAPAFENSNLLNFDWDVLPETFQENAKLIEILLAHDEYVRNIDMQIERVKPIHKPIRFGSIFV